MRTILYIIQKEFTQLKRNRVMLPIIFIVPLVQLIILVNAATMEMKNINLVVMDLDQTQISRGLINKFACSPFFKISAQCYSDIEAERFLMANKADLVLCIPEHFERDLAKEDHAKIQILVNAINGTVAGISNAYVNMITSDFNRDILLSWYPSTSNSSAGGLISVISTFWFNPELNYKIFMVPAILVVLVTIIGMFLTGLNLVREKEMGTIEQINVTPIKKYQFIIGKLIPFWIIALFELGFGLILGKLLFNIPILGSIWLIYGITMVYLLVVLGIGLLISTASETQQQAMFINFFIIIVLIMLSGIFTPVESMPIWAQKFNYINPIAYLMRAIRMIMLKGSTFADIRLEFFSLVFFGIGMLSLAVWRYKKKT
jgi:ABC-2 type transport system permease protein